MKSAGIDQARQLAAQRNREGAGGPTTHARAPAYANGAQGTYRWRMAPLHVRAAVGPVYRAFYDVLASAEWAEAEPGQRLTWLELLVWFDLAHNGQGLAFAPVRTGTARADLTAQGELDAMRRH
eukprot:2698440-Alexandrium_andersonii.AAC.1